MISAEPTERHGLSAREALRCLIRAAPLLRPHLPDLVEQTVDRVIATIPSYRDTAVITRDELRQFAQDNFEHIIGYDPTQPRPVALPSPPREMGRIHAEHGAPLAIMRNTLERLLERPVHTQKTLLDTFDLWLRCGGSAPDTAARLFCHPNTVRHRLRRLTDFTGRAIDDPADVSELTIALNTWRLLGDRIQPLD